MIGLLYFAVIIIASTLGAISGMSGGLIIRPVFDLVGADSVASISLYASVAVLTMSIVTTSKKLSEGTKLRWGLIIWDFCGAIFGGIFGNLAFEYLLRTFGSTTAQTVQIVLKLFVLFFVVLYVRFQWKSFHLNHPAVYFACGLTVGFLASVIGIGGGPMNVSLLMLLFGFKIKEATVYSVCLIFFSQFANLSTMMLTQGVERFQSTTLFFVIPAAVIGGLLGGKLGGILSQKKVAFLFQAIIICVLCINLFNLFMLHR